MISACLLFLAMAWPLPVGRSCASLDNPVIVLSVHVEPVGMHDSLAFTGATGVIAFEPEAGQGPLSGDASRDFHHLMIHELTHSDRARAGVFDWVHEWDEERIAADAACAAVWVPWCEGSR